MLHQIPQVVKKQVNLLGYEVIPREAIKLTYFYLDRMESDNFGIKVLRTAFGVRKELDGCVICYSQSTERIPMTDKRLVQFLIDFRQCGEDCRQLKSYHRQGC